MDGNQYSMYSPSDTSTLRQVLTVSQLTAQIKGVLEDSFDQVAVVGEVSNAKAYPSGHWYFSLKDKDATLPAVCFKNSNAHIKFNLEDGLMVVARGKLSVYPPRGAYQMVVTNLEPVGIGQWQLAFEQLKQKLEAEGLLAPERKRPIPVLPRRIGVVTSQAGAALHDIITALRRRNRNVKIVVRASKVQGEGSAEEIAEAIEDLQELGGIDVIIVGRGGGSIEDLWSFNTEIVARTVAACKIPIVSGVGHETDVTICDLVADLRAPTPTAAAELVASGRAELLERWSNLHHRLTTRMGSRVSEARFALQRLDPIHSLNRYYERLRSFNLRVSNYKQHLLKAMSANLTSARSNWSGNHEKLLALGPMNVLKRGFSIARKVDGQLVRSWQDVHAGDILEILLENGRLTVTVERADSDWEQKGG